MTVPLPLTFKLPDGWEPASPTAVGLPETTFVAVHPASANGFTPNITITEQDRTDPATLPEIADESLARLKSVAPTVSLQQRAEVGSPDAPGLTQIVHIATPTLDLVQAQLLLALPDERDPGRHVIVELAITATSDQLPTLVKDFEEFAKTVRLTSDE
jgi:hypothetical protein